MKTLQILAAMAIATVSFPLFAIGAIAIVTLTDGFMDAKAAASRIMHQYALTMRILRSALRST